MKRLIQQLVLIVSITAILIPGIAISIVLPAVNNDTTIYRITPGLTDSIIIIRGHVTFAYADSVGDSVFAIRSRTRVFMASNAILEVKGFILSAVADTDSIYFRPTNDDSLGARIIVRDTLNWNWTIPHHSGKALFNHCSFERIGSIDPDEGFLFASQTHDDTLAFVKVRFDSSWV